MKMLAALISITYLRVLALRPRYFFGSIAPSKQWLNFGGEL